MAALTHAQARTLIANVIGESDSAFLSDLTVWLDQSQRDIVRAHPWPSMLARAWIVTYEPYTTGTVAITTNTTGLVGTGTVFPTDVVTALLRWAPSYSSPWHYAATRVGDTSVTLAEAYRGATLTATASLFYKVDYSLPSDCEVVERIQLHDHNDGEVFDLASVGPHYLDRWGSLPESADRPLAFTDAIPPLSDGTKQVRVGPCAPDDTYRLEVLYRKATTDGSASLPQDLEDLWICRAKAYAYERDHFAKYQAELARYEAMLEDKWRKTRVVAEDCFSYGQERLSGGDDDYPVGFNLDSLVI
jgi:hypothetical protein